MINKNNQIPISIITGAAGLLGPIHAEAILEMNGIVILTDINLPLLYKLRQRLKKKYDEKKIFIYKMDVSSEKSIRNTKKYIIQKFKRINILINNAVIDTKISKKGNFAKSNNFETFSLKQWKKEIDVGLTGYFLCCKIFGNEMLKNKKGGIILNMASDLSVIAPNQKLYPKNQKKPITYSVIKTGTIGLTKYLASYWGNNGIRVNALSPGGVFNNQNKKFIRKLINLIPLQRMIVKDELKGSVKFLCSDESSYLNGHNLILDGGRSII